MLEPCILCGAPYNSLQPDFQTGWWCCRYMFEHLCFAVWNDAFHTYSLNAAWFSDGLFPEPLRGKVMFSQLAMLWCLTDLHIMISAARFSDGLGMQYRSWYEAWCGQLVALVFTLLQHFYWDIGILTKRDGNINWAGIARRTITPAADGRSRFTCSIASVFFYFISGWRSSSCGDGWVVLLELGFKDHSPSVAA